MALTSNFGYSSTARDVLSGIDLAGKTALVTGAASGIGVETARALALAGSAVTLAVRSASAGKAAGGESAAPAQAPPTRAPPRTSSAGKARRSPRAS